MELSIKTAQKIENTPCQVCESGFAEKYLREWEEARFQPQEVNEEHLLKFRQAFALNVPEDWNARADCYPFIPNGHATLEHSRGDGGNWIEGVFSDGCSPRLVFSSGKPRVVTLYSEFNTATLTPLHQCLYRVLRRKGWLLVGEPTDERVSALNGEGMYVSVDYQSATDNIKAQYVRAAIAELKTKAVGLTADQERCLDVLGELRLFAHPSEIEEGEALSLPASRGQPMGSVMSFPLLCLVNKTVVDMALTDLLLSGEVSFKEWTSHRCLINGDDLLYREPRAGSGTRMLSRIRHHGSLVGLVVNEEKTNVSAEEGEINSTLFQEGVKRKKINVSALFPRDVDDALAFAAESSDSPRCFRALLERDRLLACLRRQPNKRSRVLPPGCVSAALRSPLIRSALRCVPSGKPSVPDTNPFPVVVKPADYDLTREEEAATIRSEVARLRSKNYRHLKYDKEKVTVKENAQPVCAFLRNRQRNQDERTLKVLARRWEEKKWQALSKEDSGLIDGGLVIPAGAIVSDSSKVVAIVDTIKAWRMTRVQPTLARADSDPFAAQATTVEMAA